MNKYTVIYEQDSKVILATNYSGLGAVCPVIPRVDELVNVEGITCKVKDVVHYPLLWKTVVLI